MITTSMVADLLGLEAPVRKTFEQEFETKLVHLQRYKKSVESACNDVLESVYGAVTQLIGGKTRDNTAILTDINTSPNGDNAVQFTVDLKVYTGNPLRSGRNYAIPASDRTDAISVKEMLEEMDKIRFGPFQDLYFTIKGRPKITAVRSPVETPDGTKLHCTHMVEAVYMGLFPERRMEEIYLK